MPHDPNPSPSTRGLQCPADPGHNSERITLAHGDGGRLTRRLVRERILNRLANGFLQPLDDAARLPRPDGPLAISTDSFVVSPLFFPGGDIGSLAVFGTVNDLAVAGARPCWLTMSLIIEEGLPFEILDRVVASMAMAATDCGVPIVAGDTKVVPCGAADGLFINTTGVGVLEAPVFPGPERIEPGDELLVSGPIGRHGIAVMAARERLGFDPPPTSDSQSLIAPIRMLHEGMGARIKALRDATRGGVAAVLHEWAESCGLTVRLDEARIPLTPGVRGASELLGIDPLYLAGEGVFVAAVEPGFGEAALALLKQNPQTADARRLGAFHPRERFPVIVETALGRGRPLDEPLHALTPRIC